MRFGTKQGRNGRVCGFLGDPGQLEAFFPCEPSHDVGHNFGSFVRGERGGMDDPPETGGMIRGEIS